MQEQVLEKQETMPDAQPQQVPTRPPLGSEWLAVLSGLLLWLCHFPVAWGWLAWVALVPLLSLVRARAPRWRIGLCAWVAGLLFFWPALQWLRVAHYMMYLTWGALATVCACFLPLAIGLIRTLDQRTRLPLIATVPVVWTALEYVRSFIFSGFPWYFLGHTQHDVLPMIQIADLGGAYAVTFVVAVVNALLFEWLLAFRRFRSVFALPEPVSDFRSVGDFGSLLVQLAVVLLLVGSSLGYGIWRLGQDDFGKGPRIALLQSNIDQRLRNTASLSEAAALAIVNHNSELCDLAARQKPDLIVWPESSWPDEWLEILPTVPEEQVPSRYREWAEASRKLGRSVARTWHTPVLLGMSSRVFESESQSRRYVSGILIGKNGKAIDRYDKMHRVPFGEYVPFREWLPWLQKLTPYDYEYSVASGERFTRFPIGDQRFGVIICYEDSDPCLARQYVSAGDGQPPVDFLLNISNDGWFDGTSEHDEHLAICRFRAIECRRSIARAVNQGISTLIDPNGRVRWPEDGWLVAGPPLEQAAATDPEQGRLLRDPSAANRLTRETGEKDLPVSDWARFKKTAGVLLYHVPLDHRESLYAQWGDWLPAGCWLVLGVALLVGWFRPVRPLAV